MSVLVEDGHVTTYPLNHARIMYRNVITAATATGSEVNQPPASALTKTTYERWRPLVSGDSITGTFPEQIINTVALAAHSDLTPTVEIRVGGVWETVQAFPPEGPTLISDFAADEYELLEYSPDNEAVLFLIKPRMCDAVRITATYSGTTPSLGVLMAGTVLEMYRPFYGGHTPAMLTSDSVLQPNISESGEWLGASLLRQGRPVSMSWDNLPAAWVRREWQPFSDAILTSPYVLAWNPLRASADAIYCSSSERPAPRNTGTRNLQSINLSARGYSDGTTPVVLPLAPSSFDEQYTITRLSEGTYYDFNRVLRTAAINEPRFTHDPVTGEALGLLVEEERTNLLLWSEAFDAVEWAKSNVSIAPNVAPDPAGGNDADKLVEDSSLSTHYVRQSVSLTEGVVYQYAVFASADDDRDLELLAVNGGIGAVFDLASGSVVTVVGGSADIEPLPGGIYRCVLQFTAPSTASSVIDIRLNNTGAVNSSYQGDGTSGVYIWGAQLEAGSFPTSYIKTEGTAVTREADEVSRALGAEFNAMEGTVYVEASNLEDAAAVISYLDSGAGARFLYSPGDAGGVFSFDGVTVLSLPAPVALGEPIKMAVSFTETERTLSVEGATVSGAHSGAFLTVTSFDLDGYTASNKIYAGLTYYPRALTAAELSALTAPES